MRETSRARLVNALRPLFTDRYQSRCQEDRQVLGYGGARHIEVSGYLSCRHFPVLYEEEDIATAGFGDGT